MGDSVSALPSDRAGGADAPEPRAASQPEALIPSAYPVLAKAVPAGLVWAYRVSLRGGCEDHTWSLTGDRGGIHVNGWISPPLAGWEQRWSGGIEAHSPIPFDYSADKPDHEHCWLLGEPCWHDGSSLQFSEEIAPYLPSAGTLIAERHHIEVLRVMLNRYHSWLPEASAIEARRAETRSGSVHESAVTEGQTP